MAWTLLIPILAAAWLVFCVICAQMQRVHIDAKAAAAPDPYPLAMVTWSVARYCHWFHGLEVSGAEHIPESHRGDPGPLIVVANHTAGIDPLVITTALPFVPRWVMAQDMRAPLLEWFWSWQRVIFVDRAGGNTLGLKTAIAHVKDGGVLGIFPEGGIERPPRHVLPVLPGIGVLIARTGARVLPIVIDGTPQVDPAWASLWNPSKTTVQIHPVIDYTGTKPGAIADDLRARFVDWTGWPTSDDTSHILRAVEENTAS